MSGAPHRWSVWGAGEGVGKQRWTSMRWSNPSFRKHSCVSGGPAPSWKVQQEVSPELWSKRALWLCYCGHIIFYIWWGLDRRYCSKNNAEGQEWFKVWWLMLRSDSPTRWQCLMIFWFFQPLKKCISVFTVFPLKWSLLNQNTFIRISLINCSWIVAAFASIFHYVGPGTTILQIAP